MIFLIFRIRLQCGPGCPFSEVAIVAKPSEKLATSVCKRSRRDSKLSETSEILASENFGEVVFWFLFSSPVSRFLSQRWTILSQSTTRVSLCQSWPSWILPFLCATLWTFCRSPHLSKQGRFCIPFRLGVLLSFLLLTVLDSLSYFHRLKITPLFNKIYLAMLHIESSCLRPGFSPFDFCHDLTKVADSYAVTSSKAASLDELAHLRG